MRAAVALKWFVVLLLCLLSLGTGAVGAAEKLVLQLPWHHQFQFAGYYMALEQGYFKAAGFDVEIRPVGQVGNTVREVLSGEADFGIGGSGLVVERSLGKPVVAVAAMFQQAPTIFLALKSSGIRALPDLAGKRVMLSPGNQSLPLIALLHQEQYLDKIVRLETSFDYNSLIRGDTDLFNAYSTNEPYLLESRGYPVDIIDPQDYGIHFYGDILFTSEELFKQHPETVRKFRAACIKGWEYALGHGEETIALIKTRYQAAKDLESLRFEAAAIGEIVRPDEVAIGQMDLARWAQITQHLIAIGQISPRFRLTDDFIYQPPHDIDWQQLLPWIIAVAGIFIILLSLLTLLSRASYRAKKALDLQRSSEQRYRTLVERVPGLIYTYSFASGGTCYSPDLKSVLGYPVEYLAEHPHLWHDSIHPEDLPAVDATLANLDIDKTYELEYRIKDSQGEWRWFSDRFVKRDDPDLGEVVDGLATDITDRKQALHTQQQADQLLRDALDAVSDGVWEWNIPSGEVVLDRRSKELFGLDPDRDNPDSGGIFRLVDQDDVPLIMAAVQAHIDGTSNKYDQVFRVHRPDGTMRWVRGRGRVIESDSAGNAIRLIGTNADITERKLAEEERLESEKRFRALIEKVAMIAIQGYDEQRRVVFWNKASEQLYGYTEAEAMGQQLETLIIPEGMRDEVVRQVGQWVKQGVEIPAGELVLVDKQGREVPVFSSHVMQQTATGKEMFCIDVDMRPIKDAEKKRLDLEEQLRQVYKMEAIGTMAGGIAHDFNNSLAIILGNVELSAIKVPVNSPVAIHLQQAKTAILRARDLVQQILIYSRQGIQSMSSVQPALVLEEAIKLLRSTIPTTVELRLNVSAEGRTLLINADATQLQQIMINLCNNAVYAMQEKGVLEIALQKVHQPAATLPMGKNLLPGAYALLSFRDSGSGMTADVLEKIFDPFFTTKGVGEGTGMGLSVVHGIVESHGGFISVDSEPGQGSLFRIYFPLVEGAPHYGTLPAADQLPRGTERILFVDDEEILAEVGQQMLSEYGYSVVKATGGRQALELFRADPREFDLVITDQTMPDLTGKELTAELLQLRPDLPVILCTGYSGQISSDEAQRMGIREYCMKPLNLSQLVRIVRKVLDGTGPGSV